MPTEEHAPAFVASGFSRTLTRRHFLIAGAAAAGGVLLSDAVLAQARISTTDLGGATLLTGAGCNVVAIPGPDGALMIDGGLAANAEALIAAVKAATKASRINTLVNTHWHPEQTGANEAVGKAGGVIFAHEKTKQYLSNAAYSVTFKGRRAALPQAARPTKTIRSDGSMEWPGLALSERSESKGMRMDYGYMPAAHTDSDIYIHVPSLNLLAAGGVVSSEEWPLIDWRAGAWLGGRVRALQHLADIVQPDTRVVPANGGVMTGRDVVRQRDMYQKLFTTMIGYLNMGLGPEDAAQKNPLKEYQPEFGDPTAFTYGAMKSMEIAYVPD